MILTATTDEDFDIILQIDEATAPLSGGQQIRGRIIAMLPLSRPPPDRGAVIQLEQDTQPSFQGLTLFVGRRLNMETWNDFRAKKPIRVNVSLLDSAEHEVAAGIGTLRRAR
ncbi:hypothetical protein E6H33_05850 [Candidatus Bathyarchaeota archaeon]|nr:MAG: hypothetical protein E6H33_05850 [Candidatus Bathyarchaeota archaeon]